MRRTINGQAFEVVAVGADYAVSIDGVTENYTLAELRMLADRKRSQGWVEAYRFALSALGRGAWTREDCRLAGLLMFEDAALALTGSVLTEKGWT